MSANKKETSVKKNIMFIIPNMVGGGAEKTVGNLSIELSKFYNVYLTIIESPSEHFYDYKGQLISLKKEIEENYAHSNILLRIPFVKRVIKLILRVIILKRLKKQYNIHAAISFLFPADILNVLSKTKEKNIISLRNYTSIRESGFLKNYAIRFNLKKCDQIIAISEGVKKDASFTYKIPESKFKVIYNACVINEFTTENSNYLKIEGNNNILNVGRLSNCKGQWHLIRAFSEVIKAIPTAKLYILGVGPLNEYLNKLIIDYNLQNNIYLVGFVGNPKYYYDNCEIFAFSSLDEGLGNAVVEAIYCQVPIISTDYTAGARELIDPNLKVDKVDEIVHGEYGVIVPCFDGNKYNYDDPLTNAELTMAQGIVDLLQNESMQLHYKQKLQERKNDFTAEKIVAEWISVIEGSYEKEIIH